MMLAARKPNEHQCWWCDAEKTTNGKRVVCPHCDSPCKVKRCTRCFRAGLRDPKEDGRSSKY